jgi:hypothetical protein
LPHIAGRLQRARTRVTALSPRKGSRTPILALSLLKLAFHAHQ